jgi:hypothetical protein
MDAIGVSCAVDVVIDEMARVIRGGTAARLKARCNAVYPLVAPCPTPE